MQAVSLAGAVVLAPTLALLVGSIAVGVLGVSRFARGARGVAILSNGIALGAAIRLAISAHAGAIDVTVTGLPGSTTPARLAHLDTVAALSMTVLLTIGLIILLDPPTCPGPVELVATLLALGTASLLLIAGSVAVVASAWVVLAFGAAGDLVARRDLDAALPWLALALAVVPLLLYGGVTMPLAGAFLASGIATPGASGLALAVGIVALVSAGLTPLNGWLQPAMRSGLAPVIADAIFPLAGFYLAVRAVSSGTTERSIMLAAALIGIGLWSVGDAAHSAWQATDYLEVSRAAGRGECGLAFVALGIGTSLSMAAAAYLLAFGVLARVTARVATPEWLARVGWASALGLPPLPGFVGRWLILSAAFVAVFWPIGVAVGIASFILDVGLLGSASIRREGAGHLSVGAGAIAILLALAGLLPLSQSSLLVLSLGLPGTTSQVSTSLARFLALLVSLAPALVATIVVRRRTQPRNRQLNRNVQERSWGGIERLAQWTSNLARVVDARYSLPFGFLALITVVFAFVR